MTTRLCLIRHGETDWNASRRIQGQLDIPLNENGRNQALLLSSSRHNFSAIYCSDLSRAIDTAKMLAQGRKVSTLPSLRERHHGLFQGLTANEAKMRHPEAYARYKSREPDYDFETGESLTQFAQRIDAVLDELIKRHSTETFAIVTHAGVLDIVYRKATEKPLQTPRDFAVRNCALNWFSVSKDGLKLEAWDDHLFKTATESVE